MLKRLFTLALFLGLAIPLYAQGNTTTIPSSGPPSSTACNFNLFVNDTKNGNIYYCDAGTLTILNGGGGGGGVTSVGLVGTANQVTVTGSSPITGSGSWTLSIPAALNVGTDNSAAGTVQLANGSASAHTIFGSAATTSNSILGPAVVVANNHALGCSTSGTVCTVIDLGAIPTALPPNGSAGGDLSGSYPNPGVAQVNGAAVPASALVLGSNSSKQLTATQSGANQWCGNNTGSSAATNCGLLIGAADVTPNGYAAGGGTANAQTVTLSPAVPALATGLEVRWLPTAANTTTTPTLAVSGLTAKTLTKCGQTALVASDLLTTAIADAIYDGTDFELQNPQTGICGSSASLSSIVSPGNLTLSSSTLANAIIINSNVNLSASKFIVNANGIIQTYANFGTAGLGVPFALGSVSDVTNQTASQTSVTLGSSLLTGNYLVYYYFDEKTACTTVAAGGVLMSIAWTDATGNRVFSTSTLSADTTGTTADYVQGSITMFLGASSTVSYTTTYNATCATGGPFAYDLHASLERTR